MDSLTGHRFVRKGSAGVRDIISTSCRSNLAAVILRMAALKLGDVAAFPFLEAPDARYINDGFQVLLELGAVNERNELTVTVPHMTGFQTL